MQSDSEKVNNICKHKLEPNISTTYGLEPNIYRADSRARNCDRTSSRKNRNTYGTTTATEALVLGSTSSPAMSSKRLSKSGKKLSSASGPSVLNRSVVARIGPQKPYHPSPVHNSKRWGFGGLLSRPAVHAARRDGEDRSRSSEIGTRW
mgnify:CR=1 FL=1